MLDILKSIDLNKVVQPDLFALRNTEKSLLAQVVSKWHKDIFYSHIELSESKEKYNFIFFRSLVREDYQLLEDEIASSVSDNHVTFFRNYHSRSKGLNFELVRLITENTAIMQLFKEDNTLIKIGLYLRVIWYLYVLQKLLEIDFKVFVAFADMQPTENFIIQMLHVLRPCIQTVTLQHGLYIDYSGFETVNEVNYKNHVAKHFFAWGKETKNLILKYHEKASVFLCGKPSISGLPVASNLSNITNANLDILIVTDQKIFQYQNEMMSRIVFEASQRLGVNVYIRFHPSNNKKIILDNFPSFLELKRIKKKFIVVGHTSSLLYEAHTLGYPAFRFKSDVHHIEYFSELEFENYDELISKILNFSAPLLGKTDQYISYIGASSLEKYNDAFTNVLSLAAS